MIKIGAEINELENRKIIGKITESKVDSLKDQQKWQNFS